MKIALLQCNTTVGDIMGNARTLLLATRKTAQEGAVLCVTPELALCGNTPQHLLYTQGFVEGCERALRWLAKEVPHGTALLIGAPMASPLSGRQHIFNAAVLIQNNTYSVVSRKVFRGYGQQGSSDAAYFDHGISCGLITLTGWRLGVVICDEDTGEASFWKPQQANAHNPLMELVARGVDGIIHMAATPCALGRQETREHAYSHVAARHHVHMLVANTVGGNDALVYAGQSLAFDPTGALLARGRAFDTDIVMVDTAVAHTQPARLCATIEEECWRALVLGTRDYVRKSGLERVVVGLSGGMDSALVAAVAVEALGAKNVLGVLMPSPYTSAASVDYAKALGTALGIHTLTLPIADAMHSYAKTLEDAFATLPAQTNDVTMENLQARIRGTLLMAIANRQGSMVLNTGNKSEAAMGYCTLYGDAVGGLAVIGDVPKTLVYSVAAWYNAHNAQHAIPQGIIDRPPTAELRPNQLDSDSLPPYDQLDPVIAQILDVDSLPTDNFGDADTAPSAEEQALYDRVCSGMRRAEFKRRQSPMCLRVSGHAMGDVWHIPVVSRIVLPE